ncbi:MAG TPA: polysaccharide deacetylase family protein [Solirubrobacteraceae bacterium]|nr:polysaccharide deacetylase family protein [Solirubrobacteraceae bacterium]
MLTRPCAPIAETGPVDVEERRARRELRRRERRRRRAGALALLIAAIAAVAVAVAVASGGSSHGPARHRVSTTAGKGAARARPAPGTAGTSAGPPGPPGREAVPILMYHVIASPPAGAPFPGLYVAPEEFAAQMQALKDAGWTAVTMDQVRANWTRGTRLPAGKPIVLSFDNGYNSQYTQALPVLRRLGWVGVENIQLSGLPPSQGGLGEDQVRGLIAAGWELDTQGFSHADLIKLDPEQLHYQVAVARETLQHRFHVPVNWFCYPSGHYDDTVVSEVRAAGYLGSTTVVPGWAQPHGDPYRMPRLRVLGGTEPQALLSLLAGIRGDPPAPGSYSGA